MGSDRSSRSVPRTAATIAVAVVLLAVSSRVAADDGEQPTATFAPSEPATPDVPSSPLVQGSAASAGARRPLIVRPHLDAGVLAGGGRLGFGLGAGIRIHPVLLLYSAFVVGAGDEYMTFSGVKVGYQHTLSRWWALYATAGVGSAGFHGADGVTRDGSATVLGAGFTVCGERGINVVAIGAELLVPSAPAGAPAGSSIGGTAVTFTVSINPAVWLAAKAMHQL